MGRVCGPFDGAEKAGMEARRSNKTDKGRARLDMARNALR
jgi:hypothetical protein